MNIYLFAFLNNAVVVTAAATVAIMAEGGWRILAIPLVMCAVAVTTKTKGDNE
jgi:hypothetical protein